MKKMPLFLSILLFLLAQHGFSQSNEVLDQLLDEEQATFGKTAYLVFLAADVASEDWSESR